MKVWTFLGRADVHRDMQWGERGDHWRALPSNSPLRRYLVKIARGESAEMPRFNNLKDWSQPRPGPTPRSKFNLGLSGPS